MKKNILRTGLAALVVLTLVLSGCAQSGAGAALPGDTEENLKTVTDKASEILGNAGMSFDEAVTGENSQNLIGLSSADFDKYVKDAYASQAMIMTHAHQVVLIRCTDAKSTDTVRKLIENGFDPTKWICVFPEQCFTIIAGDCILFAATDNNTAEALKTAFADLAGDLAGTPEIFYEAANGGGGLLLG